MKVGDIVWVKDREKIGIVVNVTGKKVDVKLNGGETISTLDHLIIVIEAAKTLYDYIKLAISWIKKVFKKKGSDETV
jgi:hypothetical protein